MSHKVPPSEAMLQVLAALATRPDGEGTRSALRDATNLNDHALLIALTALVEIGWITHEGHPGSPSRDLWRITPLGQQAATPVAQNQRAAGGHLGRGFLHPRRYFLVLLMLAGLAGLVQLRPFFVYDALQPGTCTILDGTIVGHAPHGGPPTYYTLTFTYLVHTHSGQQARASGYDTPNQQSYTQDQALQVLNSYTPGQGYACWYDPADLTHAALVLRGYPVSQVIISYLVTVGLSLLILSLFGTWLSSTVLSLFEKNRVLRPHGWSLVLAGLLCLLCLAVLVGGCVILAAIWNSV